MRKSKEMSTTKIIHWLFIIQSSLSFITTQQQQQCVEVKNDIFDHCTKPSKTKFKDLLARKVKYNVNNTKVRHGVNNTLDVRRGVCTYDSACRKTFKITFIRRQLYMVSNFRLLLESLDRCCGSNCSNFKIAHKIRQIKDLRKRVLNDSDVIFPLLGTKSTKRLYGFNYIPVIKIPSAYYFTLSLTEKESMIKLMLGILNNWPLLVICLLLALISGFIVWLLERKVNTGEFPKPFREGLWESFWWSFISMTTVGYGDKTPRSCKGRLYAIIWILIGITIFALLTGSLTNEITNIHKHTTPMLLGKRVGGMKHKFHEATLIAQHGGSLVGVEHNHSIYGIASLMEKLARKEIDGFLISRASYYYFKDIVKNAKYKAVRERVKDIRMDITEKDFIKEQLVSGILIKDRATYEYLRTYFEDNWSQIQDCETFRLNHKAATYTLGRGDGVDHFEGLFTTVLYVILGILGLMAAFGVFSALRHRYGLHCEGERGLGEEDGQLKETKVI